MKQKYKPVKSIVITIIICSYLLAFFFISLLIIYSNQSFLSLIPELFVYLCLGTLFPSVAISSEVCVQSNNLSIRYLPFLKKKIVISTISQIRSLNNYGGMARGGIEIFYKENGNIKRARIGKIYGEEQIQDIILELTKIHPQIKV